MVKDGRMTGEYSWKTYDATQFEGIECGLFYRNGGGTGGGVTDYSVIPPFSANSPTGRLTYEQGEHSLHEVGLHIGGQGYFDYGFLWRFEFRITGGSFDLVYPDLAGPGRLPSKLEDGGGFFTIPTRVAFGWAPEYLFGLGAMAWGGVELAQWLANYGEERESYLDYFDYGAGGTLVVDTPYVRPSLYFGWMNTNIYWDDRVANHQGYEGRVGHLFRPASSRFFADKTDPIHSELRPDVQIPRDERAANHPSLSRVAARSPRRDAPW